MCDKLHRSRENVRGGGKQSSDGSRPARMGQHGAGSRRRRFEVFHRANADCPARAGRKDNVVSGGPHSPYSLWLAGIATSLEATAAILSIFQIGRGETTDSLQTIGPSGGSNGPF